MDAVLASPGRAAGVRSAREPLAGRACGIRPFCCRSQCFLLNIVTHKLPFFLLSIKLFLMNRSEAVNELPGKNSARRRNFEKMAFRIHVRTAISYARCSLTEVSRSDSYEAKGAGLFQSFLTETLQPAWAGLACRHTLCGGVNVGPSPLAALVSLRTRSPGPTADLLGFYATCTTLSLEFLPQVVSFICSGSYYL